MENIQLRWVDDIEILREIAHRPGYPWEHADEYFQELIALKRALVAFEGGVAIGYLLHQNIWGNTPFLSQVWIQQDRQRQGLGKQLVTALLEKLRSEGYDSLLTSNEEGNSGARAWCKKLGFAKVGVLQMEHGPEVFSTIALQ